MEETLVPIHQMTKKGRGLGALPATHKRAGQKVEVIGAGIGDVARVALRKKKRGVFTSQLIEVVSPSETREEPVCPHAPLCGGCAMQHVQYQKQLSLKQERIEALFGKADPIIGMETPWRYRNKMEYTFSEDRHGNKYLGLIEAGTRGLVMNINACHLTLAWFNEALGRVRAFWENSGLKAFHAPSGSGCLRTLTLRAGMRTGDKMAILTVSGPLKQNHLEALKEALPDVSLYIRVQVAVKGQPTSFFEMHVAGDVTLQEKMTISGREYTFAISPTAFFQPNTSQAEKLYQCAVDMIDDPGYVYDLYCGTGTIGMLFAAKAKRVVGVELNPYAVYDGRYNIEQNGAEKIDLFQGDVKDILQTLKDQPDTVIVDPPRSGLGKEALAHIQKLFPKNLLYISCNPETQAVDIAALEGYKIARVQPVDQFPHTPHIENIIYLKNSL